MSYDSDPAKYAADAALSDTTDLTSGPCRSLYIGVAGDVKVTTVGGSIVTFTSVAAGIFPVECKRVWATGTTATGIKCLW